MGIFSYVLLYYVHVYENQCYMCTKISVIQWLIASGRFVFRKNSCNLDVVLVMACSSRNNMLGFWNQVLGTQASHLRLINNQHLLLLVMNLWSMKLN